MVPGILESHAKTQRESAGIFRKVYYKQNPLPAAWFFHQRSISVHQRSISVHQRPSASISVHQRPSAVLFCGLLLCELIALARNPLSGSGCWPGSLSLTQRRKDAKGKCRDLSQRLPQARSTTGSLVLPSAFHQRSGSAVRFCGLALRSGSAVFSFAVLVGA